MRKVLLGFAASAALMTASAASADVVISFATPSGALGTSQAYSSGGYTVTATGCSSFNFGTNSCNADNTTDALFGKNGGGDENGVGLAGDPSGQDEIWGTGFTSSAQPTIILDVSSILTLGSAQFIMNSTTSGETWGVLGFNGTNWLGLLTGTTEGAQPLPGFGTYSEYAFVSLGTNFNTDGAHNFGNVLLSALVLPVPEPKSWAMMLLGFGAIGFAMRRRRRVAIPQLA